MARQIGEKEREIQLNNLKAPLLESSVTQQLNSPLKTTVGRIT